MMSVFQELTESSHYKQFSNWEVVEVHMTEKSQLIALSLKECTRFCQADSLVKGIPAEVTS